MALGIPALDNQASDNRTSQIRIALDAMGGDHGPSVVIPGAEEALIRRPDMAFIFYGDEKVVRPLLDARPKLAAVSRIHHTDVAIRMDDKPSYALRYGRKKSSMWQAIEAIKVGEADATVSAGNTGALMAMARFCLRTLAEIDRPALAGLWPTMRGESIVLDVGASIGADSEALVDMAVMGAAMARIVLGLETPSVGLLNVGVEEVKGLEMVREASRVLRETKLPGLEYHGFVEGDDLGKGTVDVVVTEGFAGNIALKAAEGTAKQFAAFLRSAMSRTLMARIGYFFARGAFQALRDKLDPNRVNGGVLLGLNGIVIKSHGGADAEGYAAAIDLAYDMVKQDLMKKITESLSVDHRAITAAASVETAASTDAA